MKCDNCEKEAKDLKPVRKFGSDETIGWVCEGCLTLLMEGKPLKGLEKK